MVTNLEMALRQLVRDSEVEVKHRVISAMIKDWDNSGQGCFQAFLRAAFPLYWLDEVERN